MKINSQVYFTLQMTEPYYDIKKPNDEKSFCNPDNFVKELVSGHAFNLFDSVQCAFLLKRKVRLFVEDEPSMLQIQNEGITTDTFKFILSNTSEFQYLSDLKKYLSKVSAEHGTDRCQTVIFNGLKDFNTTTPLFFTGYYEGHNGCFLPDSRTVDTRPLTCRPLTKDDVVLTFDKPNKDNKATLKQIWPTFTKEGLKKLNGILAKTTEKIY